MFTLLKRGLMSALSEACSLDSAPRTRRKAVWHENGAQEVASKVNCKILRHANPVEQMGTLSNSFGNANENFVLNYKFMLLWLTIIPTCAMLGKYFKELKRTRTSIDGEKGNEIRISFPQLWSFQFSFAGTAKKCTKLHNTRAKPLCMLWFIEPTVLSCFSCSKSRLNERWRCRKKISHPACHDKYSLPA